MECWKKWAPDWATSGRSKVLNVSGYNSNAGSDVIQWDGTRRETNCSLSLQQGTGTRRSLPNTVDRRLTLEPTRRTMVETLCSGSPRRVTCMIGGAFLMLGWDTIELSDEEAASTCLLRAEVHLAECHPMGLQWEENFHWKLEAWRIHGAKSSHSLNIEINKVSLSVITPLSTTFHAVGSF